MSAETRERSAPAGRPSLSTVQGAATADDRTATVQTERRLVEVVRVRWRDPRWKPTSSTRARLFGRRADALRFAGKLVAKGYAVEVHRAPACGPWAPVALPGGEVAR